MNFSTSITQCVAKAMEHLSDFTFVSMANLKLCRKDSYLAHIKSGLKQDTLAALRQAPLDLVTLFPDTALKRTEEDIGGFKDKGQPHGQSGNRRDTRFYPYKSHRNRNMGNKHGNIWDVSAKRKVVSSQPSFHHVWPGVSSHINDNYCVSDLRLLTRDQETVNCVNMCQPHRTGPDHNRNRKTVNLYQCHQTGPVSGETVNCCQAVVNAHSVVVNLAYIVQGQSQRKGVSPAIVRQRQSLKYDFLMFPVLINCVL